MADLSTVRAAIQSALDEADTALGNPTVAQQLAAKDAQIADLTSARDAATAQVSALQAKIDAAKAALNG